MREPGRKHGSKEERLQAGRARILDAARELFEAEGVGGLSVRPIARRAGMPAMTLYSYFPSKMAIVRALWAQALAPLAVVMDDAEASVTDPKARLHKVAQAFVDYWLQFPDRYKVIFLIEDRRESDEDRWFIEEADVGVDLLRLAPLIAAVRQDPAGDYRREAEALICCLIGVTHLLIGMKEYPWADSETYVELILRPFC